ncbi:hypothetical protein K458DRAFT_285736 [Lentithecium fluviatile CBS 122367]|uniref:Tautomerase cis-CaaD-like domain-containing protein n=1 Tax=Lentithecium fluviatile CBS 122367 TaxID=1168545 RepID=A0A6G1JNS2_9PLEO|nr:hypothetical protein K458DRAFT_285736 [Lentithecium fluviatile CBS 122367]
MPLWKIYHPPSTFTTPSSRQSLARAITAIYTAVPLPAFYVNVLFIPVEADSYYIGGVARPSPHFPDSEPGPDSARPFIRVTIENIARKIPNVEVRDRFLNRVDTALKPYIGDMGYDWEYSVLETSRDLWKIDGFVPPMPGTEAEERWRVENRASGFEAAEGGLEKL